MGIFLVFQLTTGSLDSESGDLFLNFIPGNRVLCPRLLLIGDLCLFPPFINLSTINDNFTIFYICIPLLS